MPWGGKRGALKVYSQATWEWKLAFPGSQLMAFHFVSLRKRSSQKKLPFLSLVVVHASSMPTSPGLSSWCSELSLFQSQPSPCSLCAILCHFLKDLTVHLTSLLHQFFSWIIPLFIKACLHFTSCKKVPRSLRVATPLLCFFLFFFLIQVCFFCR